MKNRKELTVHLSTPVPHNVSYYSITDNVMCVYLPA